MAFGGPKKSGPGGRGKAGDKDAKGGDKRRGGGFFRRRKVCKFCADKIDDINYKDTRLLMPFVPERAKILPRRIGHLRVAPAKAARRHLARASARADSVYGGVGRLWAIGARLWGLESNRLAPKPCSPKQAKSLKPRA